MFHINWKWYTKQLPNLLVRVFTLDNFYVCADCGSIHRRDGEELRLDHEDESILMSHPIWYGSVKRECAVKTIEEACSLLRNAMFD